MPVYPATCRIFSSRNCHKVTSQANTPTIFNFQDGTENDDVFFGAAAGTDGSSAVFAGSTLGTWAETQAGTDEYTDFAGMSLDSNRSLLWTYQVCSWGIMRLAYFGSRSRSIRPFTLAESGSLVSRRSRVKNRDVGVERVRCLSRFSSGNSWCSALVSSTVGVIFVRLPRSR